MTIKEARDQMLQIAEFHREQAESIRNSRDSQSYEASRYVALSAKASSLYDACIAYQTCALLMFEVKA